MFKQKAFIIEAKIVQHVCSFWQSKFPGKLYCKHGPALLGDNKVEVKVRETAIEVFSPEAEAFIMEKIIDGALFGWRKVIVKWLLY